MTEGFIVTEVMTERSREIIELGPSGMRPNLPEAQAMPGVYISIGLASVGILAIRAIIIVSRPFLVQ